MSVAADTIRILVVDDEADIRRALNHILASRKYEVVQAGSGDEALEKAIQCAPDLIILDLAMPGMDGFEVCGRLRAWSQIPILVLSVKEASEEKIRALDLGADDYLTKPFVAGELLARIRSLLRRARNRPAADAVYTVQDLQIDTARRRVHRGETEIHLTKTEFDILAYLAHNADRVVTANMIIERVWGPEYVGNLHILRVHIWNLRRKIEPDPSVPQYVVTEPGVGYSLFTT